MTSAFDGHIALVGPVGVGKTPVAKMVAKYLSIDHVELDFADEYRYQVGWRHEKSCAQEEPVARFEYDAQFSVPLITLLMEKHPSAILDCGGDDLVGWTDEQRKEIKDGLAALRLKHIAAIFPFSDVEKTRSHLTARRSLTNCEELLLANPAYRQIANKVCYTDGRNLEPVANAIIDWVLG